VRTATDLCSRDEMDSNRVWKLHEKTSKKSVCNLQIPVYSSLSSHWAEDSSGNICSIRNMSYFAILLFSYSFIRLKFFCMDLFWSQWTDILLRLSIVFWVERLSISRCKATLDVTLLFIHDRGFFWRHFYPFTSSFSSWSLLNLWKIDGIALEEQ